MKKLLPLLLAFLCLASCHRQSSGEAPKRYAFPRVETYDSVMTKTSVGGVSFEINAAADTVMPQPGWLDISYPRYGVTVHLAVNIYNNDEDFAEALANRQKRMELNFGDSRAKAEKFENTNGFDCTLVGSPDAGSAPIFFIAAGHDMRLVSGAAVFAGKTQPVDSIAPIYNAVYGDITNLLLSLR